MIYSDSSEAEYSPKEFKNFIVSKDIIGSVYKIQNNDSIICGYFCISLIIGFINA